MTLEQVQTLEALNLPPEELTAQIEEYQRLSGQQKGKSAPTSYKDAVGDKGADQPEQVWVLMNVNNPGAEAQTSKIRVASKLNWRYVVNVPGIHWLLFLHAFKAVTKCLCVVDICERHRKASLGSCLTGMSCSESFTTPECCND